MPMGGNGSGAQVGDVKFWPAGSAPPGWLKANGAAVSRAAYAALFAVIGTTYGAGDGSTTFNLPDLRGEFLRGFDDGRGVDSGRAIGSAQASQNASHTHNFDKYTPYSGGGQVHYYSGSHALYASTATSAQGGSEARPRNIAMLACIKY